MSSTRVKYIASTFLTKAKEWRKFGKLDGISTSKEIEALIAEQEHEGYALDTITPLGGQIYTTVAFVQTVTGFILTFQKKT